MTNATNTRKLVRHADSALFDDLESRNPALAARLYELAANYAGEKIEGLSGEVFGEVLSNAKANILFAYHRGVKRAGKGDNMPESLLEHPALAYAYMIGQVDGQKNQYSRNVMARIHDALQAP